MAKLIIILILLFNMPYLFSQMPPEIAPGPDDDKEWYKEVDVPWRNSRPIVEFSYGYNMPKQKKFQQDFAKIGAMEIKLGYSRVDRYKKKFLELDEDFLFGSYSTKDINDFSKNDTGDKVYTNYLRFGLASRDGYGYDLGSLALLPYNQTQFSFTRVKSERFASLSMEDHDILDRYEGSYRFGTATEGGMKLLISNSVGITASYEAAVINPRIVFFPWIGGAIVQNITVGIVSYFGKEIVNTGHWLGPIMYALLKNGAAYGVYLGMKDKQYWPFNSETPLTHETFKLSLSITF
ncbi:MAG: hypothetical protein JSW33_06165 [bacterium]|nr:MAG: hypothetical protein JSW33_06165 [bacterium]